MDTKTDVSCVRTANATGLTNQDAVLDGVPLQQRVTLPYVFFTSCDQKTLHVEQVFSKELINYRQDARQVLACQEPRLTPYEGTVSVSINVYQNSKNSDYNLNLSSVFDVLEGYAYLDKKQVGHYEVWRHPDSPCQRIEVVIRPLMASPLANLMHSCGESRGDECWKETLTRRFLQCFREALSRMTVSRKSYGMVKFPTLKGDVTLVYSANSGTLRMTFCSRGTSIE